MTGVENRVLRRLAASAVIGAAGFGVGVFVWFAASLLVPLAYSARPLEYVFLGAPVALLIGVTLGSAALFAAIQSRTRFADAAADRLPLDRWSPRALGYLTPLSWLVLAPFGAAALLLEPTGRVAPLAYVLLDLRWWWASALVVVAIARYDVLRGARWREAVRGAWERTSPAGRALLEDAALFLLLAAVAIPSSPYLRFTAILHGDEPKYLRLAENLYQGLGLDVAHQRTMDDLTLAYSPPLLRNVGLFATGVREDAGYLLSDARSLMTQGVAFKFNRGQFVEGWFVRGRNGGFYQVHNPGLSFVLFPAYYIDRHFIASSAGYQGVFPTALPVTNLFFLLVYAAWGVVVFRFLRAALGQDGLAWLLAATAMLTLPVAAFAFQIYPETTAGLIVTAVSLWLLYREPDNSGWLIAAGAGAAVGFLPFLHVRLLVLSAVFGAWGLLALSRRRVPYLAACALMIAGLGLYSYHLTGSFRPDAMYETEGGTSPWRAADSLQAMVSYPFDRIWGFFPHAPVFLFALPGWALLYRAQRRTAIALAVLIASVVLPASGHGFSGAGATPLRHLVAIVPLAMVPVGFALMTWGSRRWVAAAFGLLLIVSLDASISYNLHHRKEVGRMVDSALSGWTANLLFPWTHGEAWAHWPGTFVLFLLWTALGLCLVAAPFVARARTWTTRRPVTPTFVAAVATLFVLMAFGASALGGEWTRSDYLPPLGESRSAAIARALRMERCAACYSSFRGEIGRSTVVADAGHVFDFRAMRDDVRVGEEALFVARATAQDGADFGTLAIDFGDGRTARIEVNGQSQLRHAYDTAGVKQVNIRFTPHDGDVQIRTSEIAVRTAAALPGDVSGLPPDVAAAPVRASIAGVRLAPGGLTATLADGTHPLGLATSVWNGSRWVAEPLAGAGPAAGTWVTVIAVVAGGRSEPVTVRWPAPSLIVGAPLVLYP